MNMEQRAQQYAEIQKLEGLLAYAVAHGEKAEEELFLKVNETKTKIVRAGNEILKCFGI